MEGSCHTPLNQPVNNDNDSQRNTIKTKQSDYELDNDIVPETTSLLMINKFVSELYYSEIRYFNFMTKSSSILTPNLTKPFYCRLLIKPIDFL